MGITPTPRDRAKKLIKEWVDALAAGLWVPPPKHELLRHDRDGRATVTYPSRSGR